MKRIVPLRHIRFRYLISALLLLSPAALLRAQTAVINEFLFAPASGSAEWVELFNPGDEPVSIRGWTLSDRSGGTALLAEEETRIEAHGYLLVATVLPLAPGWPDPPCPVLLPASFPSLNNSGDDIVLRDESGRTVDSLSYTSSWSPTRGVSAERILADAPPLKENWLPSTAAAGGTPGSENTASAARADPYPRGALLFNEIMPAPLPSSCEWLELVNTTTGPVDLSGWSLAGKTGGSGTRPLISLPRERIVLPGEGYAIVAADSTVLLDFPGLEMPNAVVIILGRSSLDLGNAGDEILLLDGTGTVIDSVWYAENWHNPLLASSTGVSLELINPAWHGLGGEAWSSCSDPAGGTPGRRNSMYSATPPGSPGDAAAISVHPNPFSPDGDGHEDLCMLRCRLPEAVNQVRLRLYDAEGRCVITLRNNSPMGRETLVVWDGRDEAGRTARMGCYVALLEGLDPASNTIAAAKAVIVVARKL